MQIESHPEHQNKSLVTFDSEREETYFRLNAPLLSAARWGHLGRLGPTRHTRIANTYHSYPSQITASDRTIRRVAERLEGEVLPMIHDRESQRAASGVLDAIKVKLEPVPEAV